MLVIGELKKQGYNIYYTKPIMHRKYFGDNSGALEMVLIPRVQPSFKHMYCDYHHFQ